MEWWWIVSILVAAFLIRLVIFVRSETKIEKENVYLDQIDALLKRLNNVQKQNLTQDKVSWLTQAVEMARIVVETQSLAVPDRYHTTHEALLHWFECELVEAEFNMNMNMKEAVDLPRGPIHAISVADNQKSMALEHRSDAAAKQFEQVFHRHHLANLKQHSGIRNTKLYAFLFGTWHMR